MQTTFPSPIVSRSGRSFHWRFACDPAAAGESRRAVDTLEDQLDEIVLDDVRLLVSELVTNSVVHGPQAGGRPVRLRLSLSALAVQAAVWDAGAGFPAVPGDPTIDGESGRGLYLVDRLADRWGVVDKTGTVIWFEIDR
jgi:anti-sigma regulatory factor (Ser/Thr protein kinase)